MPAVIFDTIYLLTHKFRCSSASDALECLRQVDVNLLQQANTNISSSAFTGTVVFPPVVDGRFITKRPTQLLREGKINGVKLPVGAPACSQVLMIIQEALLSVTNAFEGAIFVNPDIVSAIQIPSYLANLFPEFRDTEVAAGVAQYQNQGTPVDQAIAILGECKSQVRFLSCAVI